jgi:initiation factor 1A
MPPKKKKHTNMTQKSKELLFRDDDQAYGYVESALGDRRFKLILDVPGETTYTVSVGKLRGSMRRSERVTKGCVVLAALRFDGTDKVDILSRYIETDERSLRKYGELEGLDRKVKQYQLESEPGYVAGEDALSDDGDDIVFESIDDI